MVSGCDCVHCTGRGGVVGVYRQWCPVMTVSTVQVGVEWSVFTGSGVRLSLTVSTGYTGRGGVVVFTGSGVRF